LANKNLLIIFKSLLFLLAISVLYVYKHPNEKSSCNLPETSPNNFDFDARDEISGYNNQGKTDYFKLALSWSPDYCNKVEKDVDRLIADGKRDDANRLQKANQFQCFSQNKFYWVVHGLWASTCDGRSLDTCEDLRDIRKHPRLCKGDLPQLNFSQIKPFLCMSPSAKLLQSEWEKHGACDFNTAQEYFAKTQYLFSAITTPTEKMGRKQLAQWMALNNKILADKKISVNGSEMYICYDKNFSPINCPIH
jgi:ribonuclease T2